MGVFKLRSRTKIALEVQDTNENNNKIKKIKNLHCLSRFIAPIIMIKHFPDLLF